MVDDAGEVDAYARLSKNPNGRKESCKRQIRDIRAAAEAAGDPVAYEDEDDNLSAWRRDVVRPAWERQMQRIREGKTRMLWVWRWDRMMRQPIDLEELILVGEPRGLIVASTLGAPRDLSNYSDRRALRADIADAALYSDQVSDKTRAANKDYAAQGRPHAGGRRPFGYRAVRGHLIPDPDDPDVMIPAPMRLEVKPVEAEVVRDVYRRFLAGESIYSIAALLRESGVPTVTGTPWGAQSVRRVLDSPVVAGLRKHHGLVVADGQWDAIVSQDHWYEAQRIFAERSQPANNAKNEYLVNRIATCGNSNGDDVCGAFLRPLSGGRTRKPTYVCSPLPGYGGCGHLGVLVENLDMHVARSVADVIDDPSRARRGDRRADAVRAAEEAAAAARVKLAEIARDYGADRITQAERDASREGPAARLAAAEKVLAERPPQPLLITRGRPWKELESFAAQRATVRAYVREVVVLPTVRRGKWAWDPEERVRIHWRL